MGRAMDNAHQGAHGTYDQELDYCRLMLPNMGVFVRSPKRPSGFKRRLLL